MPDTRVQIDRPLAVSGGVLVAAIGVFHETVGLQLYPWAAAASGGEATFYVVGAVAIVVGILMVLGSLGLARVPVVVMGVLVSIFGLMVLVRSATRQNVFHVFAMFFALSGAAAAYFHWRACRETNRVDDAANTD